MNERQPRPRKPSKRNRNDNAGRAVIRCVVRDEELAETIAHVRETGSFAFDTEFVMEDRFSPLVCLAQIATDDQVAIVDPLSGVDLSPVWALVADPDVETIVHAGNEDFNLCHSQGGLLPRNVFDCQIACGLIGADYPVSLSRMVRHYCHVKLHKSQTLTDWHRRPLSDEQIQYAAADVLHLPAIWRRIKKGLERRSRMEWLIEEMARFSQPATYRRGPNESALRVKGAGGLDSRGLAIARELVQVRMQLAQKYNRPVRAVLRDHLIIEIAKHRWTTVAQLRTLRGLSLRADAVQQLADAARRACELPNDQCPVVDPIIEETDEQAALALLVTAVLRSYCSRSDLAHQLVASRQTIRDYVQAQLADGDRDRATPLSTGWRAEAVGSLINSVLAGKAAIRVSRDGASRALIVEQ